jgi:hypothetical protein
MGNNVSTLRPAAKAPDAKRDPSRIALANAIEVARKAESALEAQREAVERARSFAATAQSKLDAAVAAINEARDADASAAARASRHAGAIAGVTSATRKARANLEDCEDAAEVGKSAVAKLETEMTEIDENFRKAESRVAGCINAIMATTATALIDKATALRSELLATWAVLATITSDKGSGRPEGGYTTKLLISQSERQAPLNGLSEAVTKATAAVLFGGADQYPAAVEPFKRWRAQLHQDPDAKMPA